MRIAQLCFQRYPSPIHVGGGDVRLWQSLCTLRALGHHVHVVVCDPTNERTPQLDRMASSVTTLQSEEMTPGTPRWLASRVFNPSSLALARPDLRGLRTSVASTMDGIDPDLIWAEEVFTVLLAPEGLPIVHSHHDFHYKLRAVRRGSFDNKLIRRPEALTTKRLRELEIDLCRRSAHTVCASRSEAELLKGLGISASYLPITSPTLPKPDYDAASDGRFFLFGNPNTAMKAARHDLQTRIWPELERLGVKLEWHQLGRTPQSGDLSWAWLEERFQVHGFVENLGDLLRPGDASVMPYPFDTGGRVKFAVGAGYGLINVAYQETFACTKEFTDRVDCLVARNPAHFAELLAELASDAELRLRLAKGARAVYERHFTMEASYPSYERIIELALNPNGEAVTCAS